MAVFAAAVIAAPPKPGTPHPVTAPARKIPGYGLRPDPGYHGVRKRAPWHGKNPGVPRPHAKSRVTACGLTRATKTRANRYRRTP